MPEAHAPSLPSALLLPTTAALLLILLFVLMKAEGRAARFVIAALWLRYVMSAFHEITYEPLFAGFSPNALASCGLFGIGLFIVQPAGWLWKRMIPVYVLVGVIVLSAFLNGGQFAGLFNTLVKWGLFSVLLLAAYEAATRMGEARSAGLFLWAFLPPISYQAISVIAGVSKKILDDGTRGYIGGYNHEAAFSIVLVTAICVAAFAMRLPAWLRMSVVLTALVGLVLAGYRTTLMAAAPITAVYLAVEITGWFRRGDRGAVGALAAAFAFILAVGAAYLMRDRFADIATALGHANLFKPPTEYTPADRELFSARAYLWSNYIDAWLQGSTLQHLIGFGPESWRDRFPLYAHNTFVSTLYELGIVGIGALLFLWGYFLAACFRIADRLRRYKAIAAHVTVICINMGTMGQWLIEGLLLYALVCALTLAPQRLAAPAKFQPLAQPPPSRLRRRHAPARVTLRPRARGF